jgi:diguanylate cyclase (GGDEF)-like protein
MSSESSTVVADRAEDPVVAAPSTDSSGRQPMINASVMMIDDEPILTEVVGAFLADAGYRDFRGENDPVVAMQHLRTEQPDVLLLDLKMPGMSGFEVLRQVRADPVTRMTPVIVLTSASDARTKLRVLELGATDFLEKPVDPSELVLRLRNTLAFKAWRDRSQWYDMLTGLPNRKLLIGRMGGVMHDSAASGQVCALVLVEIAGLRRLAAAFGHRAADGATQAVAQRLQGMLRNAGGSGRGDDSDGDNLVARIGQDEFAVMVAGLRRAEDAAAIARRLLPVLAEPLRIEGRDWFPSPALGVAAAPADADQAEALLRCARTAAMQVREQGGGLGFYSAELNDVALERLTLESELRQALERGEFELHYQPKVDAVDRRIIGCEALIRWRHPSRGLVPPGLFIPIAEEAGVIVDIGTWVLDEACRAARRWQDAGLACPVSVNVASPHLRDRRLARDAQAALEASGLDGSSLVVELTESMLMTPGDDSAGTLADLSALGVALSLDDFGTGYSSFAYLKKLNLDELKIDRSFVSGLPDDREDRAIVEAIVAMAHALGLKTVAEGVETTAQADALRELGCDHCQGWAFGRPQPERQFVQTLRSAATQGKPQAA